MNDFTTEQEKWINAIYPRCSKYWRDILRKRYFQSSYTEEQGSQLNRLRRKVLDDPELFKRTLIPLKSYLDGKNKY